MPIRTRLEANRTKAVLDKTDKVIEQLFHEKAKKIGEVSSEILQEELDNYPQPAIHPFVWSTDEEKNQRARRWYFWSVSKGIIPTDGNRYKRQNNLRKAFNFITTISGNLITYLIKDNSKNALSRSSSGQQHGSFNYVVGTFDRRRGINWQIPGHRTTGWYLIQEITTEIFRYITKQLESFDKEVKIKVRNR